MRNDKWKIFSSYLKRDRTLLLIPGFIWRSQSAHRDVGDCVPGVVNADEQQAQCRRTDKKKHSMRISRKHNCREQE